MTRDDPRDFAILVPSACDGDVVYPGGPVMMTMGDAGSIVGLLLAVVAAGLLKLFDRSAVPYVVGGAAVVGLVAMVPIRIGLRAAARRLINSPDFSVALVALCRARAGLAASRHFDTEHFLAETGPAGPRVVCTFETMPNVATPDDVNEEIDLLAVRPPRREQVRRVMLWLTLGILAVMGGMMLFRNRPEGLFLGLLVAVLLGAWQLRWLWAGWLSGLIAAPGRISTAGLRGEADFTREDSVLLLVRGDGARIKVRVVRRDGRSAVLMCPTGAADPALIALLARWCHRPPHRDGAKDQAR